MRILSLVLFFIFLWVLQMLALVMNLWLKYHLIWFIHIVDYIKTRHRRGCGWPSKSTFIHGWLFKHVWYQMILSVCSKKLSLQFVSRLFPSVSMAKDTALCWIFVSSFLYVSSFSLEWRNLEIQNLRILTYWELIVDKNVQAESAILALDCSGEMLGSQHIR